MLKEAMQFFLDKVTPPTVQVNELEYTEKTLHLIAPPLPPVVEVETLGSLIMLAEAGMDGLALANCFFQVEGHDTVHLRNLQGDEYGRRRLFITATCEGVPFAFGKFLEPEHFVISLQSYFVDKPSLRELLALVSNLTSENTVTLNDDGISQTAIVRQGIALKATKKFEPKVTLCPYRTFREVDQPGSVFLFRMQNREGNTPLCALFEADGGKWKLDAVHNIAYHLKDQLPKNTKVVF